MWPKGHGRCKPGVLDAMIFTECNFRFDRRVTISCKQAPLALHHSLLYSACLAGRMAGLGDGQLFTFGLNSHGQLGHSQLSEFVSVSI